MHDGHIQETTGQVVKMDDGLAVVLPAELVADLNLRASDEVEVRAEQGKLVIERKPTRHELLERLRSLRGTMPADYKFNREEANEHRPHDLD